LKDLNKLSLAVIYGLGVISLLAMTCITFIQFDYDFEAFFPEGDPETEFYQDFRDKFETDNDFVIIALDNDEGIFKKDFLTLADSLTGVLKELPNVTKVISPTRFKEPRKYFGTWHTVKLMNIEDESKYERDSLNIYSKPELIGSLFSKDAKSIMIQVEHEKFLGKAACDSLSFQISEILEKTDFDGEHAVGRSIGQVYYIRLMQTEMIVFISLSVVLIVLFLFIAFRSAWGIWVPVTVVMLSIIWLLGFMQFTGKSVDLMVMILPTILFVVGMSDVVHILSKYFDELRLGKDKISALKISFKEIGLATLLTSVTTAIGFLTLLTSSIEPINDFGLYAAAGVFIAFVLAYSLLPAVLVLTPAPALTTDKFSKAFWSEKLHRGFGFLLRNKKKIFIASIVLFGISIAGMSRITVNNFLLEDLSEKDPFKQEFDYFESAFSGARPFEMALEFKEGVSPWDREALVVQDKLDRYLTEEYGVGNIISPAAIIKNAYRAIKNGDEAYYKIPESEKDLNKIIKSFDKMGAKKMLDMFYHAPKNWGRINGKVPDAGSQFFFEKEEELNNYLATELKNPYFTAKITGTARLIDLNNRTLATNMVGGLLIAFGVIALIVGFMFKSIKMVVISLIPNIFPLIVIAGVMGWSGINLKVSTSIVFTIAFGIAVDDTIHFMTKLRLELAKGRTLPYALKRTFIGTGKAIIVTSLILCGGFLTLIGSDFLSVFYIGLLISITLAMAVLADLFLLPLLILWFYGKKPEKNLPEHSS